LLIADLIVDLPALNPIMCIQRIDNQQSAMKMRSRTTRLTFGAAALIAIGAAVFFLGRSETRLSTLAASVHAFDLRAREVADALAELRAAQQAYVAAGQGVDYWTTRVTESTGNIRNGVVALRQAARTGRGRLVLMEAEATLGDFEAADKRAREYLSTHEQLMAADVIFQEGAAVAASAARQVEAARLAEDDGLSADRAAVRKGQGAVLAIVATVASAIVVMLIPVAGAPQPDQARGARLREPQRAAFTRPRASTGREPGHYLDDGSVETGGGSRMETFSDAGSLSARSPSVLQTAANLCTEFGRIRDVDDLKRMLERTAAIMDARGLAVWLGNAQGADLQPVFTHGYSTHLVAQLPAVPKTAENAVARAYRAGVQQIVPSGPGKANSAIVAPILTADGCIGALSAEIAGGTEGSEVAQMLTTIVAAHLAGVFAGAAGSPERRAAQG
jgi:hypothetical protein